MLGLRYPGDFLDLTIDLLDAFADGRCVAPAVR